MSKAKNAILSLIALATICTPAAFADSRVDPVKVKKRERVIHRCLLDIYLKQGKKPEAIAEYQAVLALDPNDAPMLYAYGLYLSRNGNAAEGSTHLTKAVNTDPGNPDYAGALGTTYLRMKNFPKAVEYLKRAADLQGGKEKYQILYEGALKYLQHGNSIVDPPGPTENEKIRDMLRRKLSD